MLPFISLIGALVFLLVVVEYQGAQKGRWVIKPLASASFVLFAIDLECWKNTYGVAVLVAVILGFWGDVLLIPKNKKAFRVGILSFLLGHVAFVAAFFIHGVDPQRALLGLLIILPLSLIVYRWIKPHVPPDFSNPVRAYVIVIATMVITAIGATAHDPSHLILIGATLFWLSDLSVARHRFIKAEFINRLWGLPAYYAGQVLLVLSTATDL